MPDFTKDLEALGLEKPKEIEQSRTEGPSFDEYLQKNYSIIDEPPQVKPPESFVPDFSKPQPDKSKYMGYGYPVRPEHAQSVPTKEEAKKYTEFAEGAEERLKGFSPEIKIPETKIEAKPIEQTFQEAQQRTELDRNINSTISDIDKKINEYDTADGLLGKIELKSGRLSPLLGTRDEDRQKDYNRLHQAKELLLKLKNYKNNPKGFWEGVKQSDWKDVFTIGIKGLIQSGDLLHVARKAESNQPLSEEDQLLLTAYGLFNQYNSDNPSGFGYGTGQILTGMIPFMAQLALTGGSGAILAKGGKEGAKFAVNSYLKSLPKKLVSQAAYDALRVPLMPMTYKTLSEKLTPDVILNEQGQGKAVEGSGRSFINAAAQAFAGTFGERYFEGFGGIFDDITGAGLKQIGGLGKNVLFDTTSKTRFIQSLNELRKRIGLNNPLGELIEEDLNGLYAPMIDDEAKFSDTFNLQTQGQILLSSAIMGGLFKIAETPGHIQNYTNITTPYKVATNLLVNTFGQDAKKIIEANSFDSLQDRMGAVDQLAPLADTPEKRLAMMDYFTKKVQFDILNESLRSDQEEKVGSQAAPMINKQTGMIHPVVTVDEKQVFITNTQDDIHTVFDPSTGEVEMVHTKNISEENTFDPINSEEFITQNVNRVIQAIPDLNLIEIGTPVVVNGKSYSVDSVNGDIVSLFPTDINDTPVEKNISEILPLISQPVPAMGQNTTQPYTPTGIQAETIPAQETTTPEQLAQTWPIGKKTYNLIPQDDGSTLIPFEDGKDDTKTIQEEVDENLFDVVAVTESVPIPNAPQFAKNKTKNIVTGVRIVPKQETTVSEGSSAVAPNINQKTGENVNTVQSNEGQILPEGGALQQIPGESGENIPETSDKKRLVGSRVNSLVSSKQEQAAVKPPVLKSKQPIGVSKDVLPLLQAEPQSFEEGILQYFLSGGRVDKQQFERYSGLHNKDLKPYFGLLKNNGQQIDTINEVVETFKKFDNDSGMDMINEVIDIMTSNPGKRAMGERLKQLTNIEVRLTELVAEEEGKQAAIDVFEKTDELPNEFIETDNGDNDFWDAIAAGTNDFDPEEFDLIFAEKPIPLQNEQDTNIERNVIESEPVQEQPVAGTTVIQPDNGTVEGGQEVEAVSGKQEQADEIIKELNKPVLSESQQAELDKQLTEIDSQFQDKQAQLQKTKHRRELKLSELNNRNGLFGDTTEPTGSLFAGTFVFNEKTVRDALARLDAEIISLEKEIESLNKLKEGTVENAGKQQEIIIAQTEEKNAQIEEQSSKVDLGPTEAQKEAGNYSKGHVSVQGLPITIENPKGSVRSGTNKNGNKWESTITHTYGYFKRTEGKDGDQIDVFIGENPLSENVFVIDQIDPDTRLFDEHKVMLGFNSLDEAKKGYLENYQPGWKGFGAITEIPINEFKDWLGDGKRTKKPIKFVPSPGNYLTPKHKTVTFKYFDGTINKGQVISEKEGKMTVKGEDGVIYPNVTEKMLMPESEIGQKLGAAVYEAKKMGDKNFGKPKKTTTFEYAENKDISKAEEPSTEIQRREQPGKQTGDDYSYGGEGKISKNSLKGKVYKEVKNLVDTYKVKTFNDKDFNYWFNKFSDGANPTSLAFKIYNLLPGEDIRFSLSSPFYSNAEFALTKIQQSKGAPEQWKAMLLKNGAKQDELDWMDWGNFIKDKKSLTKEEIQGWIDENKVEVKEVISGNKVNQSDVNKLLELGYEVRQDQTGEFNAYDQGGNIVIPGAIGENKEVSDILTQINNNKGNAKYSQYTVPGGKNYKEVLLALPVKKSDISRAEISADEDSWTVKIKINDESIVTKRFPLDYADDEVEAYEYATKGDALTSDGFKSSHWDEPNIAAHIRLNEFTTKDGKRALNLEEVQSDWAQKGKKEGFKNEFPENVLQAAIKGGMTESQARNDINFLLQEPIGTEGRPTGDQWSRLGDAVEKSGIDLNEIFHDKKEGQVPNMPFKKTDQWAGLGMKWALRYAAENGFDVVTWTTGKTQAERYDLSKQVDEIIAKKDNNDNYALEITYKGGYKGYQTIPESELPNYVGKDLAEKMISDFNNNKYNFPARNSNVYSALDLKVGGEGMKGFYDQILPTWVNKYTKKWGVKVEAKQIDIKPDLSDTGIDTGTGELKETTDKYLTVHSVGITQEMKESVLGGQPMFAVSKEQGSPQDLQQYYDELNAGAPIKVVNNNQEIIDDYIAEGGSSKYIISQLKLMNNFSAVYSSHLEKVYMKSTITNPDSMWVHENGVHFGADVTIFDKQLKIKIFNKIFDSLGENKVRFGIPFDYLTDSNHVRAEEYLAYKAQRLFTEGKINIDNFYTQDEVFSLTEENAITEEQIDKLINTFVRNSFNIRQNDTGRSDNNRPEDRGISEGTRTTFGRRLRPLHGITEAGGTEGRSIYPGNLKHPADYLKRPQIETSEFKSWFGNSQMVDNNGKPLVMYHGTPEDFDVFQPNKKGLIFASPSRTFAQGGFMGIKGEDETGSVMPVYVKAENPFDYRKPKHIQHLLEKLGEVKDSLRDNIILGSPWGLEKGKVPETIKELGYDSFYVTEEGTINIAVFGPVQLKSAIGNIGKFDPNNPDIRFGMKENPLFKIKLSDPKNDYELTKENNIDFEYDLMDMFNAGYSANPSYKVKNGVVIRVKGHKPEWGYFINEDGTLPEAIINVTVGDFNKRNESLKTTREEFENDYPDIPIVDANINEGETLSDAKIEIENQIGLLAYQDEKLRNKENTDIRFSIEQPPTPPVPPRHPIDFLEEKTPFKPIISTKGEKLRELVQDRMLSVKKLQRGLKVNNSSDVYKTENLSSSRANNAIDNFNTNLFEPLINTIGEIQDKFKVSSAETQEYMRAKHAIERNAWFRNQTGIEKVFSGLSDEQAKQIIVNYEGKVPQETITKLWSEINKATNFTLNKYVEYGFMTPEIRQEIKNRGWEYYVPLRGWELTEEERVIDEQYNRPIGAGALNPIKTAKGRESISDDPLPYIASMAHSIVAMGEKNRVKQSAIKLVMNNKEKVGLFNMKKVYTVQSGIDEEGNPIYIETYEKPQATDDAKEILFKDHQYKKERAKWKQHEVEAKINGEKYVAVFADPNVAKAINYENQFAPEITRAFQQTIGRATRWLSQNFTAKNPAFIPVNAIRDIAYASIATNLKHGLNPVKFLGYIKDAKSAISRDLNKKQGKSERDKQLDTWYQEFKEWGGQTGYVHLTEINDLKRQIDRKIRQLNSSGEWYQKGYDHINQARLIQYAGKLLDKFAIISENMSRFATYAALREKGSDPMNASYAAKEVTVNFNRKGTMTGVLGSTFAFFNASVQGGVNALNLAKEHKGKFIGVAASFYAMGILNALLTSLWDDDDKYKNINDYIKQTNLVIPKGIGEDSYISIPLPQFFRQFFAAGVLTIQALGKEKTVPQMTGEITSNFFESMSPVNPVSFVNKKGGTGGLDLIRPFVPTVGVPALDLIMNEDFAGRKIVKKPFTQELEDRVASSQRHQRGVNPILKNLTDFNFKMGGGDLDIGYKQYYDFDTKKMKKVPLLTDINPSSVEHIIEYYTGGRGKFFSDLIKLTGEILEGADKAIKGDEFKEIVKDFNANSVPIFNRFNRTLYQDPSYELLRKFYESGNMPEDYKAVKEEYRKLQTEEGFKKYGEMSKDEQIQERLGKFKSFEPVVKDINGQIKQAVERGDEKLIEQLKSSRDELIKDYLKITDNDTTSRKN